MNTAPDRPMKLATETRSHPKYPTTHVVAIVYRRGRALACTWARPEPTAEQIRQAWEDDPSAFTPYDEAAGRYL